MCIVSRILFNQIHICSVCMCFVKEVQKRYVTKSAFGDHIKLNDETLTGRLLSYLNTKQNQTTDAKKVTEMLFNQKMADPRKLRTVNIEEIISTFNSLSNDDHIRDRRLTLKFLNRLDNELCRRLTSLARKEKLRILFAYMNVIPNRIVEYRYYNAAVDEIFNELEIIDKSDLLQLIFYIGLQKKSSKSKSMLRTCMQLLNKKFINNLTTEELCIICNSTFKTSTKIYNKSFLDTVTGHLINNLHLLKDPALFVTFIKTIRHNRYQSEDLLITISYTIFFNQTIKYYSFSALCHILALYSDFFYYDGNLINAFTEKCIEQLKDSVYISKRAFLKEQPRAKDIKRFLWCLSNLSYKSLEETDIKTVIIPNIMKRIDGGEFKDDFITLMDTLLYLWMLNYRAYELAPYALTEHNIRSIRGSNSATKNRLNLLLTCIYFEDRRFYKELEVYPQENTKYDISLQLKKRPLLQKVLDNLKMLAIRSNINKYEIDCQVPFLNIAGITGYEKNIYKTIYIEVLDEYTTLKNVKDMPTGLMQLKLRILEGHEEGLIVIRATEVDLMSDEELRNFLQDELDLVC